ncbi:DUF2953 domain-containing protein [Methanogenium marinum]|uniref:DUF2953 domain-containing protein n=1 Tax=Methanogenium marinum TaxID=348610 RepID=A0A9Q4PWC7_9EURY|nr:DUF2953 domain-containing protein [Methanogenium marinum]MDE4908499.1 DUF2953 domain-containing protein [Methanogenium marinum]
MIYGILLTTAALLIVFIAALLIILWAVPVTISGRGKLCQDTPTLFFGLCAKWGIITLHANALDESTINVSLFGRTFQKILPDITLNESPEKEEQESPQEGEGENGEEKTAPDIVGIADAVLPQIGPLLHQIAIDHLRARVRFGLGDAALTGEAFGLLMAIRGMLMATGGKVSLAAEAEFHDNVVEGDADGAIRVAHPLALVPPVVRIIRHPAVWKMVRSQ